MGLNQRIQVTPLHDTPYLSTNEERIRTHVLFLRENENNRENAVLLTGGAVVDVCTMSFNERMRMASTVIEEAGDIPAAVGTTHQYPRIRTAIQAAALAASSSLGSGLRPTYAPGAACDKRNPFSSNLQYI